MEYEAEVVTPEPVRPSKEERVRIELTREEAVRALAALRCYSVPRATWDTQDKFVIALHESALAADTEPEGDERA